MSVTAEPARSKTSEGANASTRTFLSLPDVVERYRDVWSKWTVYEMTRTGSIPHRKLPGRRGLIFPLDELEAWEDGASLETLNLAAGGRVCRPVSAGGGR
jgi:hypothetical protein